MNSVAVYSPPVAPPQRFRNMPLWVCDVAHHPIPLADLRPGDIGIDYIPHNQSWTERCIAAGQRWVNTTSRTHHGNPNMMHAFVVLKVQCETQQLWVADAAGPPNPGVATRQLDMSQQGPHSPPRTYLFYRLLYPQLGATLAHIAAAWSAQHVRNFSRLRCTLAPFHHRAMSRNTRARLQHFAHYAAHPAPVPALRGRGYYRFMCSEFVSTVGAVAVMTLGRVAQRPPGADFALLRGGPAGHVFACDGRGMVPSVLQARLAHDASVHVVGYVRAYSTAKIAPSFAAPLPTLRALAKPRAEARIV